MNNRRLMEIDDTDLIAIEEVKRITKEAFKPKENNFVIKWLKENILSLTTFLMLLAIIIKIVFDNIPIIFGLLGIYSILVVIIVINGNIEHKYNIEFYFKELEKRKTKITDKNLFRRFLNRYLLYKVYNNSFDKMSDQSAYYFQRTNPKYLTEEELFISAVIFPGKYNFLEEPPRGGAD